MPTLAIPSHFSAVRARSYAFRLPLFTRILILAIVAAWVSGGVAGDTWDLRAWGALVPAEVGFSSCKSELIHTHRSPKGGRWRVLLGDPVEEEEPGADISCARSIPDEHVPVHTPRIRPYAHERSGPDTAGGAVRERVRNADGACAVSGP